MKSRSTPRKSAGKSLKAAVEALAPLVKSLLILEADLDGIDRNYEAIPRDCEGPEVPLDQCQAACDRRFRTIAGKAPKDRATPQMVRQILSCFERLTEASGASLDTERLPQQAAIWTDHDEMYVGTDAPKLRASSKYVLAGRVRLRPDGSLVRRPRR